MSDVAPACAGLLDTDEYAPADGDDIERLDPCGMCFTDGEITVPEEDLVVAGSTGHNQAVHRDASTGALESRYNPHSLAGELLDANPDDVSRGGAI